MYIEFVCICVCVCVCVCVYIYIYSFSDSVFRHRLLKHTKYSPLCYTVEPCSSIFIPLNTKLLIYSPYCLSPLVTITLFSMSVGFFLFFK